MSVICPLSGAKRPSAKIRLPLARRYPARFLPFEGSIQVLARSGDFESDQQMVPDELPILI